MLLVVFDARADGCLETGSIPVADVRRLCGYTSIVPRRAHESSKAESMSAGLS